MNNQICTTLSEEGFAIVEDLLPDDTFEAVEAEFAALLNDRILRLQSLGLLDPRLDIMATRFRQGLLELSAKSDVVESILADCDITLPHQPFAVIHHDSQFHVGPALLDLVRHPKLLDVIEEVIGPDIALSPNGHARYKMPGNGKAGVTPWHRDAMTHVEASDPVPIVTCWVPMNDVTEQNGCLVVVPGGHRRSRNLGWPLNSDIVAKLDEQAIPLPVGKGAVILLDKHLPHASLPNLTCNVRWSFDLRYYPAGDPSDRPWFPSLDVRRAGLTSPPVLNATQWRDQWELARAAFASTGRLVPGRPDYARTIAEQHIERWANGNISAA